PRVEFIGTRKLEALPFTTDRGKTDIQSVNRLALSGVQENSNGYVTRVRRNGDGSFVLPEGQAINSDVVNLSVGSDNRQPIQTFQPRAQSESPIGICNRAPNAGTGISEEIIKEPSPYAAECERGRDVARKHVGISEAGT